MHPQMHTGICVRACRQNVHHDLYHTHNNRFRVHMQFRNNCFTFGFFFSLRLHCYTLVYHMVYHTHKRTVQYTCVYITYSTHTKGHTHRRSHTQKETNTTCITHTKGPDNMLGLQSFSLHFEARFYNALCHTVVCTICQNTSHKHSHSLS